MIKKEKKSPTCLYHEKGVYCKKSIRNGGRGMCHSHYINARYHVKKGHVTWDELVEKGLCRKLLSQEEKNINQMHPHKTYKKRKKELDF